MCFYMYILLFNWYQINIVSTLEMFNDIRKTVGAFQTKSNDLRRKLKAGLRLKYDGPSDDVRYSPIRQLEYPGNDVEKLMKITELWEEYYKCLNSQYDTLGYHKRIPPIALLVLENENIHLTCDLCQSPQQADDPINWYKLDSPYDAPQLISDSEYVRISQDDTLSIYRAQLELAGIYYCKSGDTRTNPYYLHVFDDNEPLIEVKPETAESGPHKLADFPINYGLKLTTTWNSWSKCSRCGKVGRKRRFGVCTVVVDVSSNFSEELLSDELRMGEDSAVIGYLGFLLLFPEGLPCRSKLLPSWLSELEELKRPNEIMTAFCKEPCSDVTFQVKDRYGKLLEIVDNTAGMFSSRQGPPQLLPMVSRATFYCALNKPFILICPGTIYIDTPTEWYVNKTIKIIPWFIAKETNKRITIDARERMIFRSIQPEDGRIYSCWQDGKIAGIVRLVTFESNALVLDHHIILIGTVITLLLFVYLFVRIYLNKTRAGTI